MILDADRIYAEELADTTIAAHVSTNILSNGAGGDASVNDYTIVKLDEAYTSGGSATVQFQLITATDSAFTVPVVLIDTGALAVASLTLGLEVIKQRTPKGMLSYSKLVQTIAVAVLTAGKYSAFEAPGIDHDNT